MNTNIEFMKNTRLVKVIFCNSSAAYYYNWGTHIAQTIQCLTLANEEKHMGLIWFIPTKDITNNLVQLPSGNFITNEDRTILEQMERLPIDEFTSQEMEDYGIETKVEYLRDFNNKYHYCSEENFNLALKCYYEYMEDPH